MTNKTAEKKLVNMLREAYQDRLDKVLSEVDVTDKQGNVIISKDLKVRHKKSGFEYTVDSVKQAGKDIKILLRKPEAPRVEDPGETGIIPSAREPGMIQDADLRKPAVQKQQAPKAGPKLPPFPHELSDDDSEVFVVDKKEFEKEYTVE